MKVPYLEKIALHLHGVQCLTVNSRDARYWILADIRYADIFKLILSDADTDTDIYTHFSPDIFTI